MTELQADKLVTQMDYARAGQITPQMKEVAEREHRDPNTSVSAWQTAASPSPQISSTSKRACVPLA